jgi:hypothetical protein
MLELELRTFTPKLKGLKDYLQKWPHKVKSFADENLNHGLNVFHPWATYQAPHTLHIERFCCIGVEGMSKGERDLVSFF